LSNCFEVIVVIGLKLKVAYFGIDECIHIVSFYCSRVQKLVLFLFIL